MRRDHRLCDMRWRILQNERVDLQIEVDKMEAMKSAAALVVDKLSGEERKISERMAMLHAELELVRKHKAEQEERVRHFLFVSMLRHVCPV